MILLSRLWGEAMDFSADDFSDVFWGHALTPQNVGTLPKPDAYACHGRECGDYLELGLKIKNEQIIDARFFTEGCIQMVACGSALTCLLKGLSIKEAWNIDMDKIVDAVGGLNEEDKHCAEVARDVLRKALHDAKHRQQESWQNPYRKGM